MSRIWKERENQPLSKEDRLRSRLEPDLDIRWLYFVQVCGFVFKFYSIKEIQEYIDFYSLKIHPSSRTSERLPEVGLFSLGDHWERQTKFDELPLRLQEESKRHKVLQALSLAQTTFSREK